MEEEWRLVNPAYTPESELKSETWTWTGAGTGVRLGARKKTNGTSDSREVAASAAPRREVAGDPARSWKRRWTWSDRPRDRSPSAPHPPQRSSSTACGTLSLLRRAWARRRLRRGCRRCASPAPTEATSPTPRRQTRTPSPCVIAAVDPHQRRQRRLRQRNQRLWQRQQPRRPRPRVRAGVGPRHALLATSSRPTRPRRTSTPPKHTSARITVSPPHQRRRDGVRASRPRLLHREEQDGRHGRTRPRSRRDPPWRPQGRFRR